MPAKFQVSECNSSEDPERRPMHVECVEAQTSSRWCDVVARRGGSAHVSSLSLCNVSIRNSTNNTLE
ncbi:hypothetical protein TNCV_1854161 [Trichonephila clavipes]|nr:hypothetical protein TNCV_1854161 [Trichonephila clavipes]